MAELEMEQADAADAAVAAAAAGEQHQQYDHQRLLSTASAPHRDSVDTVARIGRTGALLALSLQSMRPPQAPPAPLQATLPRFSVGARVSAPSVGFVGCVVEGVVGTDEGYVYTLHAAGVPPIEGVRESELSLK
jgi:hypothetical protein